MAIKASSTGSSNIVHSHCIEAIRASIGQRPNGGTSLRSHLVRPRCPHYTRVVAKRSIFFVSGHQKSSKIIQNRQTEVVHYTPNLGIGSKFNSARNIGQGINARGISRLSWKVVNLHGILCKTHPKSSREELGCMDVDAQR